MTKQFGWSNNQIQEMKCEIIYCFTFSILKFLSSANSFCSMKNFYLQRQLWTENVEVNC